MTDMITVTVQLHTVLQKKAADGLVRRVEVALPAESKIDDLLAQLEIDYPLESLLLVVNGRWATTDRVLQDGDKVSLIPAISGG